MKLKRPAPRRILTAAVGATVLATGLVAGLAATTPAHASTSVSHFRLTICDHLAGNVAVDEWTGKIFIGKARDGGCTTMNQFGLPGELGQLFLDGHGIEISQITFLNTEPIVDEVTGNINAVHEVITTNS